MSGVFVGQHTVKVKAVRQSRQSIRCGQHDKLVPHQLKVDLSVDARFDQIGIDRLVDIVDRAHPQALCFGRHIAHAGDEDYGDIARPRICFETPVNLKPIDDWHHQIQQDQLRHIVRRNLHPGHSLIRNQNSEVVP